MMDCYGPMKSGGDAGNFAGGESRSGDVDSAGVGVGTAVLASMGIGLGGGLGSSGDAGTEQHQRAAGGDVTDNTDIGDININT